MSELLETVTVSDFLSREYPPNTVIGNDILDRGGLMLLVGATSVGKSYLALQVAMSLAVGRSPLPDWPVDQAFRVLLLQAEIGVRRFQSRVKKLWANYACDTTRLLLASPYELKLDTAAGLSAVERVITAREVEVLVIDPLRPFHSRNENAAEEMQRLFDSFLRLQFRYNLSILFLHHDRKPSQGGGKSIYETRGNTVITDRPDTVARLRVLKGDMVEVVWEKMRNADRLRPSCRYVGDRQTGLFRPATEAATDGAVDGATNGEMVRALLVDAGQGLPLLDLARSLALASNVSIKTAYKEIEALERAGTVRKLPSANGHNEKIVTLATKAGS